MGKVITLVELEEAESSAVLPDTLSQLDAVKEPGLGNFLFWSTKAKACFENVLGYLVREI